MKKTFYTLILLMGFATSNAQVDGDFQSAGTVDLTTISNWQMFNAGTWSTAAVPPNDAGLTTGNTIAIQSGNSWNRSAAAIIPVGVTLLFRGAAGTTTGSLRVDGIYQHDVNGGTIPNTNATYSPGSTILVTGVTSSVPGLPASCANVIWNCTGQSTGSGSFINGSNTTTINGNFTIQSTGTGFSGLGMGGSGTARTLNINGNLIVKAGNLAGIKNTNSASATQVINVNGDVIVSGGTLYASDASGVTSTGKGNLNITGNLLHTGGLFGAAGGANANSSVISFTGINTGNTISSVGFAGKPVFVINKTGSVTLNSDLVLATGASLNIIAGKLIIAPAKTLEISSGTAITGTINASNYIVTAVSGTNIGILKADAITGTVTLPIGSANNYLPVTITPASSSDFAVSAFDGITQNGQPGGVAINASLQPKLVNATWLVNRTSATAGDCIVNTNWPASLEGAEFATYANNQVGTVVNDNGNWGTFITNGNGDNTANIAEASFSVFGSFGVGQVNMVLPVYFRGINAIYKNNAANISWAVESDVELTKFVIENSTNGTSFNEIGIVFASASSSYNYTDTKPFAGINFYRVKAFNKAGETKYSAVVNITASDNSKVGLNVYPNPVVNKIMNISTGDLNAGKYSLSVIDNSGRTLFVKDLGNISGKQNLAIQLPSSVIAGMYSILIKAGNTSLQQNVIVK